MKKVLRIVAPLVLVGVVALVLIVRDAGERGGLSASGTVEATEADLGFPAPGSVAEVAVREGDRVAAGQVLARLDTDELDAHRAAARARVSAAEARLDELERGTRPAEIERARRAADAAPPQLADAERDARRTANLFEAGAVARQAVDKATTALEIARADLDQAEQTLALAREGPRREVVARQRAAVEGARAELDQVDAALRRATLEAPFAGTVTVRHREPGEVVPAGAPVVTLLDPDDRWVRIYVREDAIGRVSVGTPATIVSDTYPDRTFAGVVTFIGSEAEFTPRNVQTADERTRLVYPVKVRVTGDRELVLKPGIPADVTLEPDDGVPGAPGR